MAKCPECKESYLSILGKRYIEICKCDNPKMYESIRDSFEKMFEDKDNVKDVDHDEI